MHPLRENIRVTIAAAASVTAGAALLTLLSALYSSPVNLYCAILASVLYTATLSCSAYYWWYLQQYIKAFVAKAAIAILVQLSSVALTAIILSLTSPYGPEWFYSLLPIYIPTGLLSWIIISLIYSHENCSEPNYSPPVTERVIQETISVKEGNRVHILRADHLHFVQAYGDYAMLYTDDGKFVKEDTMKNLEAVLPDYFVRIHRSYIVNTRMVIKTELYGKESYTVHLSNGERLRASSGGYKLLKERLSLN